MPMRPPPETEHENDFGSNRGTDDPNQRDKDRLTWLEAAIDSLQREFTREFPILRSRVHDLAQNAQVSIVEQKILHEQVSAVVAAVGKLSEAVAVLMPVKSKQESHEIECMEATRRTAACLRDLSDKLDANGRARDEQMAAVRKACWRAAFSVGGVLISVISGLSALSWWLASPKLAAVFGH